jgi:hypothetical protein
VDGLRLTVAPSNPRSDASFRSPTAAILVLASRRLRVSGCEARRGGCEDGLVGLDEQSLAAQAVELERFIGMNPIVLAILDRMSRLGLADCWLAVGAVFQTVWNVLSERDAGAGILDYDLNYFDASDLSWEAEDWAIKRAPAVFDGVEAEIQVRNEARVHLWYEEKFGVPCPAYRSTCHAVSTFPNCSSCVAVRAVDGELEVFAPYGLSDLFSMRTRPNPVLAPRAVYDAKTARWVTEWPALTVLAWPANVNALIPAVGETSSGPAVQSGSCT